MTINTYILRILQAVGLVLMIFQFENNIYTQTVRLGKIRVQSGVSVVVVGGNVRRAGDGTGDPLVTICLSHLCLSVSLLSTILTLLTALIAL